MTEAAIIKTVCAHNGSISHADLTSAFGLYDEAMESILGQSESCVVGFMNGQKTVLVRTKVRLCRAQNCLGCANLHLCKGFLLGFCRFDRGRRGCRFSHDLSTVQNTLVLAAHSLNTLDMKELRVLLLQSDNTLLPQVCHSYNNGTGAYGRCAEGESCKRLHICEQYLRGSCSCTRTHDFYEPHPMKILEDRGVPAELMGIMKDLYSNIEFLRRLFRNNTASTSNAQGQNNRRGPNAQNRRPSSGAGPQRPPQTPAEKTEICMYFIKGHCKHGDSCRREHSFLPYKWEVKEGSVWKALAENEAIERDFCDPAKTYSAGLFPVSFDTMTQGPAAVRRLSTVPSVLQPTFILTTDWSWYWEDEFGNWVLYATAESSHRLASVSSADLEQKYQADSGAVVEFSAGSQTYELSFSDMIQTNKQYKTKKLVRRRPKFVSPADVRTIKTTRRTPGGFKALPEHWDKTQTPDTGYKAVALQSPAAEYTRIQDLFQRTMRGFSILKIERIQNKTLWEVFQWQKDCMKKSSGGRDVAEKQLFHGTDSKHVDTICRNNFDWRICGTHGTAYGKGSYFARDAKYSHSYTGSGGVRSMFVCRVLVGDFTKGESSLLRPPSKDGGDAVFFDSCVDDVYNPSIFVVFEKHQIYPEYLLQYRDSSEAVVRPQPPVRSVQSVRASSAYITPSSAYNTSSSAYNTSSSVSASHVPSYMASLSSSSSSNSASLSYSSPPRSSSSYASPSRSLSSSSFSSSPPPKSSKSENQCIIS